MIPRKRTWTTSKSEHREAWVITWYDLDKKYRQKTFKRYRDAKAFDAQTKVDLQKGTHRPDSTSKTIREIYQLLRQRKKAEGIENAHQPDRVRAAIDFKAGLRRGWGLGLSRHVTSPVFFSWSDGHPDC